MKILITPKSIIFIICLYWVLVVSGSWLSIPIQVIPDETSQLLNIYAIIKNLTFKLPYETYYTFWVHLTFLPFTILYWGVDYILSDFPTIDSFKKYVAFHYMDVLPFLRAISTLFFLFSSWLLCKVIEDRYGRLASLLFLFFILSDLLIFINLHYSKHWIMDISWVFISIYFYWRYLSSEENWFYVLFICTFCVGVFSSHPLIFAGLYSLYMLIDANKGKKRMIKELSLSFIIGSFFLLITLWLGPGKILGEIFFDGSSSQLHLDVTLISQFLLSVFDFNPVLSVISIFSVVYAFIKKDLEIFLLTLPFIGYLFLIATYHFEPRYSLFLIISMSLFSAIVVSRMSLFSYFVPILSAFFIINIFLIFSWNSIATAKDTRAMALEWVLNNVSENSFVIYNSLSFNYYPLSKDGIYFLKSFFPNAVGTREKLHLSLNLSDGIDGVILRKIDEGGYRGDDFISKLISNGYQPILLNEKFGIDAHFNQPAPSSYREILDNCRYTIEVIMIPYKDKIIPSNFEDYGDILYNFTKVFDTLRVFERPGPIMTIYRFDSKQPSTCS